MATNYLHPIPSYDSFIETLQEVENHEHRTAFAAKYAIGGRINEWPTQYRKRERSDKEILSITSNLLKNPRRKTKTVYLNMEAETELVDMLREFKDEWKKWKDTRQSFDFDKNFWYTDRTLRNWYYRSLGKIYTGTSPHFLRHCRATHIVDEWKRLGLKKQLSIAELKYYFGWARLESAATYFHIGEMDII